MSKIEAAFDHGKAFIAFITCGDPDLDTTGRVVRSAVANGADLIELGIPFSDPTAEGPVIQEANLRALQAGTTTDKIFDFVRDLRKDVTVPMVFMTYANVIFSYGAEKFISTCAEIGMDGLILPDLPFEEKEEFLPLCRQYGVDLISLIAPTSENRVAMIAREAEGLIYLVSSLGVTGTRSEITTDLAPIIQTIRENAKVPVRTALRTYGIVRIDDLEGAIFYASKKYHERPVKLSATDQEQGDSDDVESVFSFCLCPSDLEYDWLAECSLKLSPHEASFVRDHILAAPACKGTLLHYILENKLYFKDDEVSSFETFLLRFRDTLPDDLRYYAEHASRFSDLVDGLFLYYNWLFSEKNDTDVWDEFVAWREETFLPEREGIVRSITLPVINDNGSKRFCRDAVAFIESENWDEMDRLVKNRERSIKGSRYKIGNAQSGYQYNPGNRVHPGKVEFRWWTVRTIVNEIMEGLGDE